MAATGKVWLVGAGPGDPELLTVKAVRVLSRVDVVVYDRLVSAAILDLVPQGVTRIFAGKAAGHHVLGQDEINRTVAGLALAGHEVARLKGGDPFVFGRGGEEALDLRRRGIPFEVVPGITAAVACAAYAGIPVTHRGVASGVQLVAGHCRGEAELGLDWERLADPSQTLVFYMGLANLGRIRDGLTDAGRAALTPVAVIADGTLASQRRLLTTLGAMEAAVAEAGIRAPAVVVIGEVVLLAEALEWFHPQGEPAPACREAADAL